jgi:SAM-dependent methyltransferase
MASELPRTGRLLDAGSGHGLFSLFLAQDSSARQVTGMDHDGARVALARRAADGIPNAAFTEGSLLDGGITAIAAGNPWDGIAMIDVLHYFAEESQRRILAEAFAGLEPGGALIAREVEPDAGLVSSWNRLYERLATRIGFTRSEEKSTLHFRSRAGWESLLRETGFVVRSKPCSHFLFADILYVCERPRA